MNLTKAVQAYPFARRAMKRVLMKALNDEHSEYAGDIAMNRLSLGSDTIIKTIAEGDAAFPEARDLLVRINTHGLPFWDGEINTDNIDEVRRAAEKCIYYKDDFERDECMRGGWCESVRCAGVILQLTKYSE